MIINNQHIKPIDVENINCIPNNHHLKHNHLYDAGVDDEQSVEKFNKILAELLQRYVSQRGLLETKYFMRHVMFYTSPKWQ